MIRQAILLVFVVLPGFGAATVSTYYLFPEWIALENSHQNFQKVAQSSTSDQRDILIAQAAENRHRINCLAEGVGVLLGGVITAIGIHGMCTLPQKKS